jgi:hypothetical protein
MVPGSEKLQDISRGSISGIPQDLKFKGEKQLPK